MAFYSELRCISGYHRSSSNVPNASHTIACLSASLYFASLSLFISHHLILNLLF